MNPDSVPNGGPAFPFVEPDTPCNVATGMSLRDYFAAKAMHQFLHGAVLPAGFDATESLSTVAARSYEMADAMLRAREGAKATGGAA